MSIAGQSACGDKKEAAIHDGKLLLVAVTEKD
jgi:hypothetical protein